MRLSLLFGEPRDQGSSFRRISKDKSILARIFSELEARPSAKAKAYLQEHFQGLGRGHQQRLKYSRANSFRVRGRHRQRRQKVAREQLCGACATPFQKHFFANDTATHATALGVQALPRGHL
jgi:hypothetical protein